MKSPIALLLLASLAVLNPVHATALKDARKDRAEASYDSATHMAKEKYKADKANCKKMTGNDKDVCMKDAKAAYVTATSQAKADEKSAKGQADAEADQLKADYKAAKERCDALSGSAEDACVSEAKVKYRQ